MLVLSRSPQEALQIGDVRVIVSAVKGNRVRLAIDAPAHVRVTRVELLEQLQRSAADAAGQQDTQP